MDEPLVFPADDLHSGLRAEFEREITAADVIAFAELSRDWNPLHLSEAYAAQTNYGERIVHGAFQVALASAMAGMYLPGRDVVVGSFQCRFPAPLRYPAHVRVQGEITAWVPQSLSGTLRVRVIEVPSLVMTSEIHVGFGLHETRSVPKPEMEAVPQSYDGKPAVLLTGASGGIGRNLAASLSRTYHVIGMARSRPEDPEQTSSHGMEWVAADLA